MAKFYTLAMEFTPKSNTEIMTALLSNRCLAFINLEKFGNALADADACIKIKPQWFRVSRHLFLACLSIKILMFHEFTSPRFNKPPLEVRFGIADP